jgi:hypothetical protein
LAAAGGLPCARASCRPMASAIRRMRGSRGSPLDDPLSLAGQGPCRSSSSAMPMLPRQDPSDESNEETRSESRKFRPSTCSVEMLAGGEPLLPQLLDKTPAGPATSRPVRAASRRCGRANSASLYRMAPVRPHGGKQAGTQVTTTAPARVSCRNPNAARIAHDALDTAGAAQHFQLADMGTDGRKPRGRRRSVPV